MTEKNTFLESASAPLSDQLFKTQSTENHEDFFFFVHFVSDPESKMIKI